jgi:hypothetical protein
MNRDEIVDLLTAVAVGDHRTVGQTDVDLWHAVLNDIPKDAAIVALVEHRREQPGVWLEAGHIYQRVRAQARDRMAREPLPQHRPDEEPEHYPGDAKAAPDIPDYPAHWNTYERTAAYWYALRLKALPRTTAGWQAIAEQLHEHLEDRTRESR